MKALREIGVEGSVLNVASTIERNVNQTPAGRVLAISEIGEMSRQAGAPSICLHRAALRRILLEALPEDCVRTGARCVGFSEAGAMLESGEVVKADVVIGADGISSVIRAELHGAEPPRYAGYTCWRGIVRRESLLADCPALLAVGGGMQFGVLPCGEGKFYWFLTRNAVPGTKVSKREVAMLCRDWAQLVPQIIEATPEEAILQNDIVDRVPLRWWGRGRVTLLEMQRTQPRPIWGKEHAWLWRMQLCWLTA